MGWLPKRLSYANVTSTLALVIALGMGSAYAADQLAPKSVGEKQLRPGAVTANKLRKNSVTAPKIASLAVKQGKIANGAVSGAKIADSVITSEKLPSGAITTEKISGDAVTGEKVNESTLSQVPSAKSSDRAIFADSSNPEAFAQVNDEGTVFPGASKGIGVPDVKQGKEPGIYCVRVPGFVPTGAQVTPEYTGLSRVSTFLKFGGTTSCPYPQVEVQTYNNELRQKLPFFIVLYR